MPVTTLLALALARSVPFSLGLVHNSAAPFQNQTNHLVKLHQYCVKALARTSLGRVQTLSSQ